MKLIDLRIPKDKHNDHLIRLEFSSPLEYIGYDFMKFLRIDCLGYYKGRNTFYLVFLNFKLSFSLAGKKGFRGEL